MLDWANPAVAAPTRPVAPLKVALYTTLPNQETGAGGVEVAGGAYARSNITMGPASAGQQVNTAEVSFPTANANWGTVVGAAIVDSSATPMVLWIGPLAASKIVDNGDTFKIPAGQMVLSLN